MDKNLIKRAFLKTVPVMAGYLVLGTGFGMLLESKGFGVGWTFCMSAFIYAGSMQYVAVDLLASGASLISAAITTLLVNARHIFYGISVLDKYKDLGKSRIYAIFALTDETYSLVCRDDCEPENRKKYYLYISLFNQIYWVTGSVVGSLLGAVLPFGTAGIDFSLTALFITVFVEQWLSQKRKTPQILGVLCSVACLLAFSGDSFLIPSLILITAALTLLYKREKGAASDE